MLTSLSVHNLAVVERIELDLERGLTVVTGQTGAGKSLLVDALLLLSGTRADSGFIRAGCKRAELAATFDTTSLHAANVWLNEHDMDEGDSCLLRRTLRVDGRSRAWINGQPATMSQLAELAPLLLEIHGQHEHQSLLLRHYQLRLVDGFLADPDVLARLETCFDQWHEVCRHIDNLAGGEDPAATLAWLDDEISRLEPWALSADDLSELENDYRQQANIDRLIQGCRNLIGMIEGDDEHGLDAQVASAATAFESLLELDERLQPIMDMLASAGIQLREAVDALRHYAQDLEPDPERFASIDTHLSTLHELARRHNVPVIRLQDKLAALQTQRQELEQAGERLQALTAERDELATAWARLADELTQQRTTAARSLASGVTALMPELGMHGGQLDVTLQPIGGSTPDRQGRERVEFRVTTNSGQPLQPLRKVASGGELARIGLAIEVAALPADAVGTMVFDEVDTGIGGAVAEVVGKKLRALGDRCQVLCVTHLPQVAAQGHHHLRVSKLDDGQQTQTVVTALDGGQRREELARMLGGVRITDETLAHAGKMLAMAQS